MEKLDKTTIDNLRTMIRVWYWADEESEIICDMGRFTHGGDITSESPHHICGSVCCGLGMAPLTIPPEQSDRVLGGFDYHAYSKRVFPSMVICQNVSWDWVFDSNWQGIDDTFRGVALRANYLLNNEEKVTWHIVNYNYRGGDCYMFSKDNHDRTIPYLEAERKEGK